VGRVGMRDYMYYFDTFLFQKNTIFAQKEPFYLFRGTDVILSGFLNIHIKGIKKPHLCKRGEYRISADLLELIGISKN
jgi:hypothetical protein